MGHSGLLSVKDAWDEAIRISKRNGPTFPGFYLSLLSENVSKHVLPGSLRCFFLNFVGYEIQMVLFLLNPLSLATDNAVSLRKTTLPLVKARGLVNRSRFSR